MKHKAIRFVKLSAAAEALETTEDSLVTWLRVVCGEKPVTVHKAGGETFSAAPMSSLVRAYAAMLAHEWEEENNI
jgi:hypothetical protein